MHVFCSGICLSSPPCLIQTCRAIEMKWLLCLLLGVLATFTGVEGQGNCTYAECFELLSILHTLPPHTPEYCAKHNETLHCVNEDLQQCGELNSDIALAILADLFSDGPTCVVEPTTTTETPMPTPTDSSIDCSYTLCNNLFHALNSNDSSYCRRRAEAYDCLNTTLNSCPNGGNILNHDNVKMELDSLPSSSCVCVRCDDLYNALAALSPTDSNYCELHKEVDDCTQKIFDLCNSDDTLFWHAFTISSQLGQLPDCNNTQPPSSCKEQSCLNGAYDCYPQMELNDGLPSFIDKSTNCAAKHEDNFYYCGIYSYSHLRAFDSNHLYTCSSPGLWALFSHPALKVTAQNSVPNMNGPYTVVDELNVVIAASNCSQETIYHASAVGDYLTATFEDGTNGVNGLELILNSNGTSAYIRISWINTVIVIHKLAGHIGIAIRSPASVANGSVGLCSLDCPEHSKLTVQEVLDRDSTGNCTQEAYISCGLNNGTLFTGETEAELYYEKCIFDTLNTNNTNSSWISLAMVNSWHLLGTVYSDTPHGSTSSPEYENQQSTIDDTLTSSSSNAHGLCITMVTWCLMLYAITMPNLLAS